MKLIYIKILCLIVISSQLSKAFCTNNVDSLTKTVNTTNSLTLKSKIYLQLANLYNVKDKKLALDYYNQSISCSRLTTTFPNDGFIGKVNIFLTLGMLDSANRYIGLLYNNSLKTKNTKWISLCYEAYGRIYLQKNDNDKAIEYFTKHLLFAKNRQNNIKLSSVYNYIGTAYAQSGKIILAKEYFLKSITNNLNLNNLSSLGSDYNNIGIIYAMSGKFDSSYIYLKKGLDFRIKTGDSTGIGGSYNNLAQWHTEKNEFLKAKQFADSAFSISKNNSILKLEQEVYETYEQIYKKQGKYELAYSFLKNNYKTQKKIDKENVENNIAQLEARVENEKQQTQLLEKDLAIVNIKNQNQNQTIFIIVGLVLFSTLGFITFLINKSLRANKLKNNIIHEQKKEVENQNRIINEKHKDITDSIKYAHRIQSSLIPTIKEINKQYEKIDIWFQPRDIVSGDFYWYSKNKQTHILALADCTGHGVPGAFMSIIGINYLNSVVNEKEIIQPNIILQELKKGVISSLNPNQIDEVEKKDGMDVALICFNENEVLFAGANQSVLILRNFELIELKGNRQPIGLSDNNEKFDLITQPLLKGDRIILYSDGVIDQFGGENGKKLKSKQFKNWLIETAYMSYNDQTKNITKKINEYKNKQEQTDDITLIIVEI
jgi:serine phosphatase RsbU (regulator of sigma subunit)